MKRLTCVLAVAATVALPTVLIAAEPPSKTASQGGQELVGVMEFKGVVRLQKPCQDFPDAHFGGLFVNKQSHP